MNISIYTLTSQLHDEKAVDAATAEFLGSLNIEFDFQGSDFSGYGDHALNLIYVRTGGTEGIFRKLLPQIQAQSNQPIYLLTSGKSNSLAASMEILSYLRLKNIKGEILHGTTDYISGRINLLTKVGLARKQLNGCRLGVVGEPSDWLISSNADYETVKAKTGIELINIPMQELLDAIKSIPMPNPDELIAKAPNENISKALPIAEQIYLALKIIIKKYALNGFTLRCFDLLTAVKNTGCLALAKFNSEGIIATCEGDVPAMLSMAITNSLTEISGFQANPAHINPISGKMLFAHCTIPFNMIERYEFDTHFESGIGVGIRGYMKNGPVTIFKVSGNLGRHFAKEGKLVCSQAKANLCRTQQVIQLDNAEDTNYFLTNPIGNHHIIVPGNMKDLFDEFMKTCEQ
jgi:L-fucose isomerase-like protein